MSWQPIERTPRDHRVTRLLYGSPIDGRPRTNATMLRRGNRSVVVIDGLRPPSRWAYLSAVERAGIVWACIGLMLAWSWAWTTDHPGVLMALAWGWRLAVAAGCGWAGWRIANRIATARHYRDHVRPLHLALHQHLGHAELARPDYIDVPLDFAEPGAPPIIIDLPHHFDGQGEVPDRIVAIVGRKLGLPECKPTWRLQGRDHQVRIRPANRPPLLVDWHDPRVQALIEAAPEPAPLLACGADLVPIAVDLDADAPHVLLAASSGFGKSSVLRAILTQSLPAGGVASIIDMKQHSLRPFDRLPGVDYARELHEMHEVLCALGAELHRRNRLLREWEGEGEPELDEPRHLVVVDEVNMTLRRLRTWWTQNRSQGDPKESPALLAYHDLVYAGRAVRMHLVIAAQSATAQAVGGGMASGEAREGFATRILARYSPQAWAMLTGITPMPPPVLHRGRGQVILNGAAHEAQMLYVDEATARAVVRATDRPVDHPGSPAMRAYLAQRHSLPPSSGALSPGRELESVTGRHLSVVPEPSARLVTLREAVDQGVITGLSLEALNRARDRDRKLGRFPEPASKRGNAEVWPPEDLALWQRSRPRARTGGEGA